MPPAEWREDKHGNWYANTRLLRLEIKRGGMIHGQRYLWGWIISLNGVREFTFIDAGKCRSLGAAKTACQERAKELLRMSLKQLRKR